MKKLVVVGAGGHARSVVDSALATGKFDIVGFVDPVPCEYRGICTLGDDTVLPELKALGVDYAFVGLGFLGQTHHREKVVEGLLRIGFTLPSIIDPSAVLAEDALVGAGSFIGKGAVVNAGACVDENVIINTAAIVEHDCWVGSYSHVSVNATLCGGVKVGSATMIGASATIIQGVVIGSNSVIGAGSTVLADVPSNKTIVGIYNGR